MEKRDLQQCYVDSCNEVFKKIKEVGSIDKDREMALSKKGIEILQKLGIIEYKDSSNLKSNLFHFSELGKNLKDMSFEISLEDIKKFI